MNNLKNNIERLTESQKLRKKEMLLQMEKEIKQLEFYIHHSKIPNLKIHILRGLKTALRTGQLVAPYILTAAITFGGFAIAGKTPFIKDDIKKKKETKKELDNFGNIKYEQSYDGFHESNNTISYVSNWTKQENGSYSREIKTYAIKKEKEDIITVIINNFNTDLSLDDLFGKPTSSVIQSQNNLTDEEIQKEPYLKAVIYSESNDDFIIVKESTKDNTDISLLWILLTVLAEIAPLLIREKVSSFDYEDCIKKIKEKHKLIDTKELAKKLEIKRNNYNRLTR